MEFLVNIVVLIHLSYFVFVMFGFLATRIGIVQRRSWVLNPWLRKLRLRACENEYQRLDEYVEARRCLLKRSFAFKFILVLPTPIARRLA